MVNTKKMITSASMSLVAVLSLLLVIACSSTEEVEQTSESTASPAVPASNLNGTIEIDGSSTVYPISEAVAEDFGKLYKNVRVNVGVSGTGGGFKRFIVGETDITDASRPIKQKEIDKANYNDIKFHELKIGADGLSVIVNPSNNWVDCLTVAELKKIWEPGSTINNWNQVRSSFPDKKMRLYGPDTDSGTFDYFTEEINGEAQLSRSDYTMSANDNVLVQGIAGDKGSLGYFGYAYYAENKDKLKVIGVDNGDGCVVPSGTTIQDGSYKPLSRPLFIYLNVKSLGKPEVKEFVRFYMVHGKSLVDEVGYVSVASSVYEDNLNKIK